MAASNPIHLSLLLLAVFLIPFLCRAQVPDNETFRHVNEGEFGIYITEYDASYRTMPIARSPFQLMWYNTTPGEYYVGLRMGIARSESLRRWVWDANRGRPVGEGATLSFARDGNFVLADADGRVVWSTGTANKGAVALRLLPTGNIVIYDNKGSYLWQSFDHPSDTLMVGQSLYVGGPTKLVSRRSRADNSDGTYSFELEPKGLNLFFVASATSKRLLYSSDRFGVSGTLRNATLVVEPTEQGSASDLLMLTNDAAGATFTVARPKYNATLSFLRVAVDGNLEVYTYYDPVDYDAWQRTYAFFSEDGTRPGCELPARCGALGVCEDDMCVACPTRKGLLGWSRGCAPPALGVPCKKGGKGLGYYKVVGVESFVPNHNKGLKVKVNVEECRRSCSEDCECLGFFYYEESSSCWLAPVLGSLSKVATSSHVAYIKYTIEGTAAGFRGYAPQRIR